MEMATATAIATITNPQEYLPKAWLQLRYHEKQSQLWRTSQRFIAVAAGRGSGKTELARRRIIRYLAVAKSWQRPLYFYALPTYKQAKRVAWRPLLDLIPKVWIKGQPHETDMRIETIFGSILYVVGMDKPQRIEGDQWDGGIIDEACDHKPNSFALSILPALSHRNGWCWRIGVPKRVGSSAAEFKEFCYEKADEYYTWPSSDILLPKQLQYARETLDVKDFNEQYNASWESVGGAIFYAFNEVQNVRDDLQYNATYPLIIGSDFNVSPMAWIISQYIGGIMYVLDEIFMRDTNTQATLNHLYDKYGRSHKAGFEFYGDATGRSRNTRASMSDYLQIRNDSRFEKAKVYYPVSNPYIANRFAACNAALCNANGNRRIFIHSRCKNLIRDLNARSYVEGTNEPNDSGDIGHITDAFGYAVYKLFPLHLEKHSIGGQSGVHTHVSRNATANSGRVG